MLTTLGIRNVYLYQHYEGTKLITDDTKDSVSNLNIKGKVDIPLHWYLETSMVIRGSKNIKTWTIVLKSTEWPNFNFTTQTYKSYDLACAELVGIIQGLLA